MKIYTIHNVADNGMSLSTRNFRRFLAHIRRTVGFADPQALAREGQADGALIWKRWCSRKPSWPRIRDQTKLL